MIYILHGENVSKSRALLVNQQVKLGVESKVELDGASVSEPELRNKLASQNLFGDKSFIVLDITKLSSTKAKDFFEVVSECPEETVLIIYSEKTLPKSHIFVKNSSKIKAKIIQNDLKPEGDVFKFVDAVFSRNRAETYKQMQKLQLEGTDQFYLFNMLLYGLRNLALLINEAPSTAKMHAFVKSKTQKQASNFSKKEITEIYSYLYYLDKDVKTGNADSDIFLVRAIEKILHK